MISSYLVALSEELRVPRRALARILAETRDHLMEAVAAGQTEAEATRAFGDPTDVSARFHEQLASSRARRASGDTVALMVAFVIAMTAAAFGPSQAFPAGIVVFIGAQLAAVAGAIAGVRWLRYRSAAVVPASRLADLYRANLLTVAAVAVVALAAGVDALGSGRVGIAIVAALMLVATMAVALRVRSAVARAQAVQDAATSSGEDILDDLLALAERYAPPVASLARRSPVLYLRRSPWRFCLVFAAACGIGLAAWHGVVEAGGPATPEHLARAVLAGLVIASVEAVAVLACFAAFGRLLAIRR